jgi:hypothetical protein
VNRRQKCTDQHHQQIDFHVLLRCTMQSDYHGNAKGVRSVQ